MLTLDPLLEQTLLESLRTGDTGSFLTLDPLNAERLALEVARDAEEAEQTRRRAGARLRPAAAPAGTPAAPGGRAPPARAVLHRARRAS